MEPNWRDGKGIDFVRGFDKVIVEDGEGQSGNEMRKWFAELL